MMSYIAGNMLNNYSLKDFEDMILSLSIKSEPKREFVLYTGRTGIFMFDLAIKGINLPKNIRYTYTTFKKLHNILYLNIGLKHSNTKVKIDMNKKTYSSYSGTIKIGDYNTVEKAIKSLKL